VSGALPQRGLDVIIKRLGARSAHGRAPARTRYASHPPEVHERTHPYAAFFMRSRWAACSYCTCEQVSARHPRHRRVSARRRLPVRHRFAVILIAVETIGAAASCWDLHAVLGAVHALEMIIAILAVKLPHAATLSSKLLFAGPSRSWRWGRPLSIA